MDRDLIVLVKSVMKMTYKKTSDIVSLCLLSIKLFYQGTERKKFHVKKTHTHMIIIHYVCNKKMIIRQIH